MARYFPLDLPIAVTASRSGLLKLSYDGDGIQASFATDDSDRDLSVWFPNVLVFRVLDEVWLSTEGEVRHEGHRPDHLAYRIEGSVFGKSQSPLIAELNPNAREFLFVTGDTCLNVISDSDPVFDVVIDRG